MMLKLRYAGKGTSIRIRDSIAAMYALVFHSGGTDRINTRMFFSDEVQEILHTFFTREVKADNAGNNISGMVQDELLGRIALALSEDESGFDRYIDLLETVQEING